jgi:hypothetical protein
MGDARLRAFTADGAERGAPLPVAAVEHKEVFALLESEHVSEVMRLVFVEGDLGAWFEPRFDEETLELG